MDSSLIIKPSLIGSVNDTCKHKRMIPACSLLPGLRSVCLKSGLPDFLSVNLTHIQASHRFGDYLIQTDVLFHDIEVVQHRKITIVKYKDESTSLSIYSKV